MKRFHTLLTSVAIMALTVLGLPNLSTAQSQASEQAHGQVPSPVVYLQGKASGKAPTPSPLHTNKDGLQISLQETGGTTLLGGESIVEAVLTNTGPAPLFNVGWTIELPEGVSYQGIEAMSGDFGEPKVTILLWGNGKQSTYVHWNNAVDISPEATATVAIKVKNAAPKGTTPTPKKKVYVPGETFTPKAWASGSTNALVLPVFGDYGIAVGKPFDTTTPANNRVWAADKKDVKVEAVRTSMAMDHLVNGIALRGNKGNQREVFFLTLEKASPEHGNIQVTKPVTVKIDAAWEIMGVCAKSTTCFKPKPGDVRWDETLREWALDIPASAFDFGTGTKAQVHFEIAALDKKNVKPTADNQKVNMAGMGGDGGEDNPNKDDEARLGAGAPAYGNNTGAPNFNIPTTFAGETSVGWTHPWNSVDSNTYKNQPDVPLTMPRVLARVEDATIKVGTAMVGSTNYQNGKLVNKTLTIETNEYANLPDATSITVEIPKQECFFNTQTASCVEDGVFTFARTSTYRDGDQEAPGITFTGTVSTSPAGVKTLTIPASSIPKNTSASHTITFQTMVRSSSGTVQVVNGKPLKTDAYFNWPDATNRPRLESNGEIPPSEAKVVTTVAYPQTGAGGVGTCPTPFAAIPQESELNDPEQPADPLAISGWGKQRLVSAGDILCFQVNVQFPEGIDTKQPVLNVYLPPKGELNSAFAYPNGAPTGLSNDTNDVAVKAVKKPEHRQPVQFTFGDTVPGSKYFTTVYQVVIKDGGIVDPGEPLVLWDNLAKLAYLDHDGDYHNARDAASYEFIGPTLMLTVDQTATTIDRGAQTPLTYTVKNIGKGPALAGTRVAIRLPESIGCDKIQIAGLGTAAGHISHECVGTPTSPNADPLLRGNYAIVTLNQPVGKANEQGTDDELQFSVTYTTPSNHAPKTAYQIEAGIVSYEKFSTQLQKNVKLLPRHNALCKNYKASGETEQEAKDTACALQLATLTTPGADESLIGSEYLVAIDAVKKDNLNARVSTILTTKDADLTLTGTSTDLNPTQNGNADLTVAPGEKGTVTFTLNPPPGLATSETTLTGSTTAGNTQLVFTLSHVDPTYLGDQTGDKDGLKTAVADALGTTFVDKAAIQVSTSGTTHTITVPLKAFPTEPKTITFTDLFTTGTQAPTIDARLTYTPVTLVHKDEENGENRLGQPPVAGAVPVNRDAPRLSFIRKEPALAVSKAVTTPTTGRIVGKSEITYQIQVNNTSDVTAYNVNITDTLPEHFKHSAQVTTVAAEPSSLDGFESSKNWALSDGDRKGVWPTVGLVDIPPGGSIKLTYVATAPDTVTSEMAYRNTISVPYTSRSIIGDLGNTTYGGDGHADVTGAAISVTTTLEPQTTNLNIATGGYHPNGKVQGGELVKSVTRISIPDKVEVPSLSLLSRLTWATIARNQAKVTIDCNGVAGCSANPALMAGDPEQFGVVITDQTLKNESGAAKEVVVTIEHIRVEAGEGTLTGTGNVYRSAPTGLNGFKDADKASAGTPGTIGVQQPALAVTAKVLKDGNPLAGAVEPGTPNMSVQIGIRNTVAGTQARDISLNLKQVIGALGFTIADSFTDPGSGMTWTPGSGLLTVNKLDSSPTETVITVPVNWNKAKFTPATTGHTTTVDVTSQTGPLNAIPGSIHPESRGRILPASTQVNYRVVYPTPGLTQALTDGTGTPVDRITSKPDGGVKPTYTVAFTPTITQADGFNGRLCIRVTDPKQTIGTLTLSTASTAAGVREVTPSTLCENGEREFILPVNGQTVSPVTFTVETDQPVTKEESVTIAGTFKVQNRLGQTNADAVTKDSLQHTATVSKTITVVPDVDLSVAVAWIKDGTPATSPPTYNDFDTEQGPVTAQITFNNVGGDTADKDTVTVALDIPKGWTIQGNPNPIGWACVVTTPAGSPTADRLTCTRTADLPPNGPVTTITVQSPSGPGTRLAPGTLTIRGASDPAKPDRAATHPQDANGGNDTVNSSATVTAPKPDLSTQVVVPDPIVKPSPSGGAPIPAKPFTVTITHTGDPVRGGEITVTIGGRTPGASQPTGTVTVRSQNGWACTPQADGTTTCVYPNAHNGGDSLPPIRGSFTPATPSDPVAIEATSRWTRPGPGGTPIITPDTNPANDTGQAALIPFNQWIDAGVTVTFTNPTPGSTQDAGARVTVRRHGGGADLPGTGTGAGTTTLTIKVPEGASVQDGGGVSGCTNTTPSAQGTHVWTCRVTQSPSADQPLHGPTITGVTGPNRTVEAELTWPGYDNTTNPGPYDPNRGNNTATNQTRPHVPPPAPLPPAKPSEVPNPSDRPTNIPQPPPLPATPAPAQPGPRVVVNDPIDRSQEWIETMTSNGETIRKVLIGRDNVFADSLSSGGLQGMLNAPLLLNPVDHLSEKTKERLAQLNPEEVVFLGGPVAQDPAVEAAVQELGYHTSRVQGPTRIETAIDAAKTHAPNATHGVLARAYASNWSSGSQAFADTLSGGAFAARKEIPVFLTTSDALADTLRDYLASAKINHLTLLGSHEAISPAVEVALNAMGIATTRISGANRAETAVNVAQQLGYWHAGESESVLLVDGDHEDAWTDAFPAALYAKLFELPILLTSGDAALPETAAWVAPGAYREPPTRVICGYSVGQVSACTHTPGAEKTPDTPPKIGIGRTTSP